jgi:hypothetical protein
VRGGGVEAIKVEYYSKHHFSRIFSPGGGHRDMKFFPEGLAGSFPRSGDSFLGRFHTNNVERVSEENVTVRPY